MIFVQVVVTSLVDSMGNRSDKSSFMDFTAFATLSADIIISQWPFHKVTSNIDNAILSHLISNVMQVLNHYLLFLTMFVSISSYIRSRQIQDATSDNTNSRYARFEFCSYRCVPERGDHRSE